MPDKNQTISSITPANVKLKRNPIQVNVHVLRDECDCILKKKGEKERLECGCNDNKVLKPESKILSDGNIKKNISVIETAVVKKEIQTLEASAVRRKDVRKSMPIDNQRTYDIKGRTFSNKNPFDWKKIYKYGEKGSGFRTKQGGAQDFYQLREEHSQNGTLFEDPEFPANNYSLFGNTYSDRSFVWKRPGEIVRNPQLFVGGFSRFDVQQGELGDCWLLAAVANLTMYKRLFFQIVPNDQDFDENYAGIFHFRFWQYGRWIDVVIDDLLPTDNGELVYLHSTEKNEFWSALLEKAYAKLYGSYESIKGGSTCEAMEDFTGGVTEMYQLDNPPPNLFKILEKAFERASLIGCSLEPDPDVFQASTPEGLVRGHAYSVTKVIYLDITTPNVSGKIPLLRLRNPWGNEVEWNGAWSDNAPEWKFISEADKRRLGLIFDDDGEFWMSYKDFSKYFDRIEICNLNPDSLSDLEQKNKKVWEMSIYEGAWVRGVTAGGCRNFLETFWCNPQYRITLTEVDDDDSDNKCTVIVALMQKFRREVKQQTGAELLTIGFAIYYLPQPDHVPKPLNLNFFKYNASVARSPSFINLREVSCRFKLPPGTYCIVPSTYDQNEEGEFLLRVFSEHRNNMEENDDVIGHGPVDERVQEKKEIADLKSEIPIKRERSKKKLKAPAEILTEEKKEEEKKYKEEAMQEFLKIAGKDKEIDYMELKDLLDKKFSKEMRGGTFSKDLCRAMIAMLDIDFSGKLDFEEYQELWDCITIWKKAFFLYDADQSGSLSGFELRNALNSAGYRLTNHVLNILMNRYGNSTREIAFDEFIMCAVKLKAMIDKFQSLAQGDTISLTKDEWIQITLYS